jgi:hypothetical protein
VKGPEVSSDIIIKLSQKEAFDKIIHVIEERTKFSVENKRTESPSKIVAYGGRGPSKAGKVAAGVATFGIGTVVSHYSSPKRYITVYINALDVNTAEVLIRTEGFTDGDSRVSTVVNTIYDELITYRLNSNSSSNNDSSDDPVKILKTRFAKGEISKEEFEEMKKTLE